MLRLPSAARLEKLAVLSRRCVPTGPAGKIAIPRNWLVRLSHFPESICRI